MTAIFIVFLLIIAGAFFDMLNKSVYVADAERRAIEKLKEIQRNTHHDFTDSEIMVIQKRLQLARKRQARDAKYRMLRGT